MGLRRFFQRVLPHRDHFTQHKQLSFLGEILHDPDIFHVTRRSMSGGVAVGLFLAFIPVPGQMVLAALAAIYFRVNLPLAITLVWITNPLTIPAIFYLAYKIGAFLLNEVPLPISFEFSFEWLEEKIRDIWDVVLVGCLTLAIVAGTLGYFITDYAWRIAIIRKIHERKQRKS